MMTYEEYAKIRDEKGLTDGKVAKLAGFGRSTFTDWKSGRSMPKVDKMKKIADVLGMYYMELVDPEGKPLNSDNPEHGDMFVEMPKSTRQIEDEEFRELYLNATPEIQQAVLTILKSAKHDS